MGEKITPQKNQVKHTSIGNTLVQFILTPDKRSFVISLTNDNSKLYFINLYNLVVHQCSLNQCRCQYIFY
jgi:hypothetical protein